MGSFGIFLLSIPRRGRWGAGDGLGSFGNLGSQRILGFDSTFPGGEGSAAGCAASRRTSGARCLPVAGHSALNGRRTCLPIPL
jgi:hypothetical protein